MTSNGNSVYKTALSSNSSYVFFTVAAACVGVGYAYLLQVRVVDGSDQVAKKLD